MIPQAEYLQRARVLRSAMAARNLDALLCYGSKRGQVRYISGYHPNYIANAAMVVLPKQGDAIMRIRFPFDLERARESSWIPDIAASGNTLNLASDAAAYLVEHQLAHGTIGLVTGDIVVDEMPRGLFQSLADMLPDVTWSEAGDVLQGMRLVKTASELDALRGSAQLADLGAEAAQEAVRPGVTEFEVVACAEAEMRRAGAEGYLVVISSKGERELIGPPESKSLEKGDNVIIEIAVQREGYWTQVARVFSVGQPTRALRRLYDQTYRAFRLALTVARPGRTCSELARSIGACLENAGLADAIEQDFGHGIGLDLPESPRIEQKDHTVIQEGMVLVIHPAVRKIGVGGVFIGGTALVQANQAELIHEIPDSL